jgi:hypothetical protein
VAHALLAAADAQGYPLRMEEEVKQLHKLAELQRSKDAAMESRQAEEAKASIKAKCVIPDCEPGVLFPARPYTLSLVLALPSHAWGAGFARKPVVLC